MLIPGRRRQRRLTHLCPPLCMCRLGWERHSGVRVSGDAFQPDFAPPQIDAAGAKHPLAAEERFAGNAVQHDGRRLHPPHFSVLFVDETFDTGADTKDLAAEGHELGIEPKTSVRKSGVQRCKNLVIGLYPHQVARLETKIASGRGLSYRNSTFQSGKRDTAGNGLKLIVQPASRAPPSVAESQRCIVVEQIEKAAAYLGQGSVA